MKARYLFLVALLLLPTLAAACVWGGFDATRVNYPGGVLYDGDHSILRGYITGQGGSVALPTPELTPAYLDQIDVFYTSLLSQDTGVLSAPEQTALQAWVANGGTLIVTGDIYTLDGYESFTSHWGVTNWTSVGGNSSGSTVNAHPVISGVSTHYYNTNSTFTYGADALLIMEDASANTYAVVMDPSTGFNYGGKILVTGDHNGYTDGSAGNDDNQTFMANFVAWACAGVTATDTSSWSAVKSLY
ncbi:MAG: hypothetical protein QGH42_00935 [Kiritimatiellia bacterium]|nr:hypothetical protein [Kiritimatiellia bacterium]